MDVYDKLLAKLEEIRENEWTRDDALKIWGHFINEGEGLLEAIARNLAEAIDTGQ